MGTGLGLAVSYAIVKRHGGKIQVQEANPAKGPPLPCYCPMSPKPTTMISPGNGMNRLRLAIVDDEAIVCRRLSQALVKEDFEIEAFSSDVPFWNVCCGNPLISCCWICVCRTWTAWKSSVGSKHCEPRPRLSSSPVTKVWRVRSTLSAKGHFTTLPNR